MQIIHRSGQRSHRACSKGHTDQAVTCAQHVRLVVTVRDGSLSAASAGRSRHEERRRGKRGDDSSWQGMQQSQFAENSVRHSRRLTRYRPAGSLVSHEWAVM